MMAAKEQLIINAALDILKSRIKVMDTLSEPQTVMNYLQLKLMDTQREVVGFLFLDVKNRLLRDEVLFEGSLTHSTVYPREVVKAALFNNAASVIMYHNHPSGISEPSPADNIITKSVRAALEIVDVRLCDHIIVVNSDCFSYAQRGLL